MLCHEAVPDQVAQVAVVDDNAFAGVVDDLGGELVCFAQRPFVPDSRELPHDDVDRHEQQRSRDEDLGGLHRGRVW